MPGGRVALGSASSDHGRVAETPGRDASPLSAAGRLALAVLLAIPFFASASTLVLTTSFLAEFLGQGRWRPLSVLTREPLIRPLPVFLPVSAGARPVPVDLYTRTGLRRSIFAVGPGLVGLPFFALGEAVGRLESLWRSVVDL